MFTALLLIFIQSGTTTTEPISPAERVKVMERTWRTCTIESAIIYSETSNDSASDIATASIEKCRDKELDWSEALYDFNKSLKLSVTQSIEDRDRALEIRKKATHQSLVYTVVEARSHLPRSTKR